MTLRGEPFLNRVLIVVLIMKSKMISKKRMLQNLYLLMDLAFSLKLHSVTNTISKINIEKSSTTQIILKFGRVQGYVRYRKDITSAAKYLFLIVV